MLQPFRLALALALVSAVAARAEPAPGGRVRRERSVTVTSTPADPLPVIRVARDTMTPLFFSTPIQKKTLTFDESRIRVLDAGERSVIVQPYMHGRGILHRDLKLSNVLIRKSDGEPVIIDFSCATYTLAEDLTDGGLPPGTDRYRAPEQFQFLREHKDERRARYAFQGADEVFAVGVMLHELLTDPRPTECRARFDLNNPALPPPPPRLANSRVPAALSDLVENLLSRDPTRRPVDTEALRRELADLRGERSAEYDVPAPPPSEQRHGGPAPGAEPAAFVMPPTHPLSLKRHAALFERPRAWRRWVVGLAVVVVFVVAAIL